MRPLQVLPFRVRVHMVEIAVKEYSQLTRSPELDPHHQMQVSVTTKIRLFGREFYSSAEDTVSIL